MKRIIIALAVLAAVPVPGRADDSKQEALTLLPWTDASVVFTAEDKRARVQYSQVAASGFSATFEASAPLDEDTRIAAFTAKNRLVSGWKGGFQIGWDTRARRLGELQARLAAFADALKTLKTVTDARVDARVAFSIAHGIQAQDREILRLLCERLKVTADACATAPAVAPPVTPGGGMAADPPMTALVLAICRQDMGVDCDPVDFPVLAKRFLQERCPREVDLTSEPCSAVAWMAERIELTQASATVLENHRLVQEMWSLLEQADPDQAKELKEKYRRPIDAIVADPDAFADTLKAIMTKAALERRDILLTGQVVDATCAIAVAMDGTLSYDRAEVYQDDIATTAKDTKAYDAELGLSFSFTPHLRGLSLSARTGIEWKRESGAKPFERCTAPGSGDPTVSGKQCDPKALFRAGAQPARETGGYVRLAVDYQYHGSPKADSLTPGVEARLGMEGLGADESLELRLALFGTPVSGTSAARVGVALAADYAIDAADDDAGRWTFTPMAFIGATFSGLMASR